MDFSGAKIVLHTQQQLIVYLRDDKPSIPFPNQWDLPGGGREDDETPLQCALREVEEEFGLRLPEERIVFSRCYPGANQGSPDSYFMALPISEEEVGLVHFGDEGQRWQMMSFAEYLRHPDAVGFMQSRLKDYLDHKASSEDW